MSLIFGDDIDLSEFQNDTATTSFVTVVTGISPPALSGSVRRSLAVPDQTNNDAWIKGTAGKPMRLYARQAVATAAVVGTLEYDGFTLDTTGVSAFTWSTFNDFASGVQITISMHEQGGAWVEVGASTGSSAPALYNLSTGTATYDGLRILMESTGVEANGTNFVISSWSFDTKCVRAGTSVRKPAGEVPIQTLRIGDLIVLHRFVVGGTSEEVATVTSVASTAGKYAGGQGVRIGRGSLGGGIPRDDTYVTRNHPVLHNDAHYEAGALVGVVDGVEAAASNDDLAYFGVTADREGAMVLSGNLLAHVVPPARAIIAGEDGTHAPRTNLLSRDDGRAWHTCEGNVLKHEGGKGVIWR